MNCEFCKKTFANNSSLNVHQTSAKYCLKIQGKIKIETNTKVFECSFCNKVFNFKHHLNQHIPCCKNISIEKDKENKLSIIIYNIKKLLKLYHFFIFAWVNLGKFK
jgi:hypothetical protein